MPYVPPKWGEIDIGRMYPAPEFQIPLEVVIQAHLNNVLNDMVGQLIKPQEIIIFINMKATELLRTYIYQHHGLKLPSIVVVESDTGRYNVELKWDEGSRHYLKHCTVGMIPHGNMAPQCEVTVKTKDDILTPLREQVDAFILT